MNSTIYLNGSIVTVDDNMPSAEAVLVRDGKIAFVGSNEEALKLVDENTERVDLEGKAMLPGFIDAHSHVSQLSGVIDFLNLSSPPLGNITSIEDIKDTVRNYIEANDIKPGGWVVGYAYNDSLLAEKRHPLKFDLDEVSTEHNILLAQASGHVGCLNSKALASVGYNENTPNPEGGIIARVEGTNEPNGYLEENAFIQLILGLPKPPIDVAMNRLVRAQEYYASYGVTTTQEGLCTPELDALMTEMANRGMHKIDIVSYPDIRGEVNPSAEYNNGYRMGGAKTFLDGSPQGKTAWLTKPYHVVPEGEKEDYCGYPIFTDEQVYENCKKAIENNIQLLTHQNGDAAIDQFLNMYEKAMEDTGLYPETRPVLIHAQTMREDQLERIANAKVQFIPSFFPDHTFFWGDYHLDSVLGEERGSKISPLKTALDKGITWTAHQDTPVLPPDNIRTINSCVNRNTLQGRSCGEAERVSVLEAIKGVTINGAYSYFEEDSKGTITVGKRADLVILDKSPLEVDPTTIKDIVVLETIKDGKTIYKNKVVEPVI